MTAKLITQCGQHACGIILLVTAGEAQNPSDVLPKATNNIIYRILIFYIGALVIIMALVPWNELSPTVSPFVYVFEKIGVPAAAGIINLVVITAAASSCNGGIFSTGRMLYTLGQNGHAPAALGKLNSRKVPAAGIHLSALLMVLGVGLNYLVPEEAFSWITSVAVTGSLWTWIVIMASHAKYRQAIAAGRAQAVPYRMPGAPIANWLVIIFLLAVTVGLAFDKGTRVALYVAPLWFAILAIGWLRVRKPA